MRNLKLLTLAALIGVATLNSQAATTNLLQTVSFALTIYSQGPVATTKAGEVSTTVSKTAFNSQSLIQAVAKDLGVSVSSKATLDLVSQVAVESSVTTYTTNKGKVTAHTTVVLTNGPSSLSIVDGTTLIPVPNTNANVSTSAQAIDASTTSAKGILTSETKYNVYTMTVATTKISFTASGFGSNTLEPVAEFGTLFNLRESDLSLAGVGTDSSIIVDGTVTTSFAGTLVIK